MTERAIYQMPDGTDPRQQILGETFFNEVVASGSFFQGVIEGVELASQGVQGKTIQKIREENGLPSRIEQLREAQEEWGRQGHA